MSEELLTPTPEATPTPAPAVQTQPQAVNVDIQAIAAQAAEKAAEIAQKRGEGSFKSIVKQEVPDIDADALNQIVAEWKSKQTTPEQELKLRDDAIGTLTQQLEAERQEKAALAKGVPLGSEDEATKAKAAACMTLAKSYVSDDVTFEAALDKAMQIISFTPASDGNAEPKPPMWGGAGTKPIAGAEIDAMKAEYEAARKNKDGAKMSFLMRKAQEKNIQL